MNYKALMENNGKKELAKFRIFVNHRLVFWTDDEEEARTKLSLAIQAGLDVSLICA